MSLVRIQYKKFRFFTVDRLLLQSGWPLVVQRYIGIAFMQEFLYIYIIWTGFVLYGMLPSSSNWHLVGFLIHIWRFERYSVCLVRSDHSFNDFASAFSLDFVWGLLVVWLHMITALGSPAMVVRRSVNSFELGDVTDQSSIIFHNLLRTFVISVWRSFVLNVSVSSLVTSMPILTPMA
jgi:hypothetical protein